MLQAAHRPPPTPPRIRGGVSAGSPPYPRRGLGGLLRVPVRLAMPLIPLLLFLAATPPAHAAPPVPPGNLQAVDHPNDAGNKIDVTWVLSPDDRPDAKPRRVLQYEILRRAEPAGTNEEAKPQADGTFTPIGTATYEVGRFTDSNCATDQRYSYQVVAVAPDGSRSVAVTTTEPVSPKVEWFDWSRAWFGGLLFAACAAIVCCIILARRGRDMKLRKIPGLQAVDEAVGRATEMGRSCLFIPGVVDIDEIATVAGLTVLARVARTAAEYDCRLVVPTSRSLAMAAARETVQQAYFTAGRPDAYHEDDVYYLTDEQFGFAAGVTGMMVRDKPAACFYFGQFYAESLYLAETGNVIGAIQIAGTAETSQLPFFVAACDYVLIGEEFFAASAYLSGEPQQLGTLKGQDVGKLFGALLIVIGCGLATLQQLAPDWKVVSTCLNFLKHTILG